jgi:glycosyltransferase involved in cell wall biosynthesis
MVHDLFTFSHPETYTLKHRLVVGSALVFAIRNADRLLVPSEHTRSQLARRFGVRPERVAVTPLAPANRASPRSRDSVSDDEMARLGVGQAPFLFTLSTVEPRKNLPGLLHGFRRLLDLDPDSPLRLVVGGARGWKSQSIERRVRELGLEDRVDFLGFVPDDALPALFARCEGFVLASLTEGFGMPVLEAMHFGAPVACSNTGALPEVAGSAALLFDPLDADDIARSLRRLLDPEERRARIEAGRRQAASFSWGKTARETLAALEGTG